MDNFQNGLTKRLNEVKGSRNVAEMARHLGISHARLSAYFRGESVPSAETLALIAKRELINVNWLLTGEGDMRITEEWKDTELEFYKDTSQFLFETLEKNKRAPTLARLIRIADELGIDIKVLMPEKAPKNACFSGPEAGTIHELGLLYGDVLSYRCRILCSESAEVLNGDLVIAKVKRRGQLFKRVYFAKARKLVMLHSVNPARDEPPIIVDQADVEYRYKVIGVKFE